MITRGQHVAGLAREMYDVYRYELGQRSNLNEPCPECGSWQTRLAFHELPVREQEAWRRVAEEVA